MAYRRVVSRTITLPCGVALGAVGRGRKGSR